MTVCFIIPPHIFNEIKKNGNKFQRQRAEHSIRISRRIRVMREEKAWGEVKENAKGIVTKNRIIYTTDNTTDLPGHKLRSEGGGPTNDLAADQAYFGTGATFDLYANSFLRNSIDNDGLSLVSSVHYSEKYDNAFWDGQQMVYGDGDGQLFGLFTKPIDVTGHELTHGVTQYTANLTYQAQSGALNESFSDIFGSLVKQQVLGQTAQEADWLIGEGIFTEKVKGKALRSLKAPGTAYDDPVLGHDPQPSNMNHFVETADDNGGVHINSGIPNHAFYLAAIALSGNAWEKAGKIWYKTLIEKLGSEDGFESCANATIDVAGEMFGKGSFEQKAVEDAWKKVGVL